MCRVWHTHKERATHRFIEGAKHTHITRMPHIYTYALCVQEETNVELTDMKVVAVKNVVQLSANYHYVVFFVRGQTSTEPCNLVSCSYTHTHTHVHTYT